MRSIIIILLSFSCLIYGQTIYNPQQFYDTPGGFFDEDSLRSIYLNFYDNNYHSILVDSWFYDPSYRIPAQLTLNGTMYDSVGVRYKGNSTFCLPNDNFSPKVPFNIDMNYFVGGQKLLEYKKMKLANAWMDPTFAKQIVSSNIYRKYLPTGESNLVKLYVQGNYNGLYVNDESINKQFLNKHFDEKDGPLFKCDNIDRFCDTANAPSAMPPNLFYMGDDTTLYYNSYDMKSDNGWTELVELIKTINIDFENIEDILNVDRVLWAFAVNQVVANLDCYNTYYVHNYYLYQTEDGLFQMIPWDLDNSFIGAIMGWDFWNPTNVYQYDLFFQGPNLGGTTQPWDERPLLYNLLNDPLYRKIFTAHVRTIINESLDTNSIRSNVNQLQALAYSSANQDQNKAFSMSEYLNNAENAIWANFGWGFGGIMSTVNERKTYLLSHPEVSLQAPEIYSLDINNNFISVNVNNATSVELMLTTSEYNSKFEAYTMYDNGSNGDVIANDGIFTIALPISSALDVKFYIRAHNNDAISLLPERAEYEFFEYSIPSNTDLVSSPQHNSLIEVRDVLGRKVHDASDYRYIPLIYIYDDGTIKKNIIIE